MKLIEHPIRVAAIAAWLCVLAALAHLGGQAAWMSVALLVLLMLAIFASVVVRRRGEHQVARTMAIATGAVALTIGSLALQAGLNAGAMERLGAKAYFESADVRLELLDEPTQLKHSGMDQRGESDTYQAHARLLSIAGKPVACGALPLNCAPRGQLRFKAVQGASLRAGDQITGYGLVKPGKGRDAFVIRLADWHKDSIPQVWSPIAQLREGFKQSLDGITPAAKSLVSGLAIGVVDEMPVQLRANMQVTGLTHLTAVSGTNCVIVIGLIWWLLSRSRLGRQQRLIGSLAALFGYVLLVGQQPSVLRAALMLGAVMLGRYLGRGIQALDALAAAIVALLFCDPWLAIDLGFLLSVLATAGLVMLTGPIGERLGDAESAMRLLPNKLRLALAVVLAAQVLCLPVIIGLSQALPLYTLPANLLAEPLVAPITVLGMAAVATSFMPWLASALTWVASVPAQLIVWIADFFAGLPGAAWPWPSGLLGVIAATVICLAVTSLLLSTRLRRTSWIALAAVSAACLAFGFAKPIAANAWSGETADVVMCDVGQGDALVIRSSQQTAVVDVGPDPKLIDSCLNRLEVTRIDLLVLTHFDMDHVGGITGALTGRQVSIVLETPWPDTRPTVAFIQREVGASGAQVVRAQTGLGGQLGELVWQVLSPSKTASEAEDSNDGSIVMSFSAPTFNLLALADLGERGQMRLVQNLPGLVASLAAKPLILKVAHHGSADIYPELYEALHPTVALIGVGIDNGYGHPTKRALNALESASTRVYRTDRDGSIAVNVSDDLGLAKTDAAITVAVTGGG